MAAKIPLPSWGKSPEETVWDAFITLLRNDQTLQDLGVTIFYPDGVDRKNLVRFAPDEDQLPAIKVLQAGSYQTRRGDERFHHGATAIRCELWTPSFHYADGIRLMDAFRHVFWPGDRTECEVFGSAGANMDLLQTITIQDQAVRAETRGADDYAEVREFVIEFSFDIPL